MRRITCHVSIWLLVSCLTFFGHSDASGQVRERAAAETERAEQKARERLNRKGVTDEQIKKAKAAFDLNPPQTQKAKGVAIRPAGKFDQPPKGRIALEGHNDPVKFSLSTPSAKPEAPVKNAENKEHVPADHLNTHPHHHGHHIHHTHSQPEGVCGSKNSPIPVEKCRLAGEDFNKAKPQN